MFPSQHSTSGALPITAANATPTTRNTAKQSATSASDAARHSTRNVQIRRSLSRSMTSLTSSVLNIWPGHHRRLLCRRIFLISRNIPATGRNITVWYRHHIRRGRTKRTKKEFMRSQGTLPSCWSSINWWKKKTKRPRQTNKSMIRSCVGRLASEMQRKWMKRSHPRAREDHLLSRRKRNPQLLRREINLQKSKRNSATGSFPKKKMERWRLRKRTSPKKSSHLRPWCQKCQNVQKWLQTKLSRANLPSKASCPPRTDPGNPS